VDLNKYSVTWKVTGMLLFILLVSFVIHVVLIVPRFTRHSENYARNILQEKARGVASSIDGVLRQAAMELEKIARHPDLVSMEPARIDQTLLLLDGVTANFLSLWVHNSKGIIISRPDKSERVGADRSDFDYFTSPLSMGRTFFSNFFISPAGNLTTTVSTPVRGPDKTIRGVLVGSLGIDERNIDLFRVITEVSIGDSGFAYLVDGAGRVIAHPEVSQPGESFEGLDYRSLPHIRELVAGKTGSTVFLLNGVRSVVGYAPVPSSGWGVVVQQPISETPDYSGSLLTYFLSIFAAMFVVSAMMAILFTRHLLRPLKLLGQTAGAQAEGYENGKVRDEIQILSSHIGGMVDQITTSEKKLKEINQNLKEEIEQRKTADEALSFNLAILDLQLERSPDGILVVNTDNKVISFNQRFKVIWGIPEELLEAGYDPPLLDFVQEQMADPEMFLKRIHYLYQNPRERSHEDIYLSDGRVLERHSEPMAGEDGTYYGRVWYFRDITDQKRSVNEIRHALREKETLLKEVHHRVKNNLQAVSSILDLQSVYITDGEAMKLCRDSKNRILTMALLHENLYRGQDQTRVDLKKYVSALADHLLSSMERETGSIVIDTRIADVTLNPDTAIPCGLIITELVSNSLKHAFPGGRPGKIRVDIAMDGDDRYRLTVSDDGVGLPDDWDLAEVPTLGLKLVGSLSAQLSGTMEISSGRGATFSISFREYTEYHGIL